MAPSSSSLRLLALVAALATTASTLVFATAADNTLYWDPTQSNTTLTGGTGTWNTSAANSWYDGTGTTRITWATGTSGSIATYYNLVFGGTGQIEPYTLTTNLSTTTTAGALSLDFRGDYLFTKTDTQTNTSLIGGSGTTGTLLVSIANGKTLSFESATDSNAVNRIALISASSNSTTPAITLTGNGAMEFGQNVDISVTHANGHVRVGTPNNAPTLYHEAGSTLTTGRLQVASGTVNLAGAAVTLSGSNSARGNSAILIGGGGTAENGYSAATVNISAGTVTALGGTLRIDTGTDEPWGMGAHGVAFAVNPVSSSLTAFNNYTGGTLNLTGGTLVTTNVFANPYATSEATARFVFNGGTLEVASASTQAQLDQFVFGFGSTSTNQVQIAAGGAIIDTGSINTATTDGIATISSPLSGEGLLTKRGANTLRLTGTGSYTGGTTIEAGTLLIDGDFSAASGALSLAGDGLDNRAILGGSGTIGSAVTLDNLGDTLSPGSSPGILTFGTAQSWSAFSYDWEVNDFLDTTAGVSFDAIQIAGALTLSDTGSYQLNLISLTDANAAGLLANFSEADRQWSIISTDGGIANFDPELWSIGATGFTTAEAVAGSFSLGVIGNDLVLSYTAFVIPEPASVAALFGALAAMGMLWRRRRSPHC